MKYEYVENMDGLSQYDDYNLKEQNIVLARYVPALISEDKGNPFIETLPLPRNDEEVMRAYIKTLPSYRFDKVKDMSNFEKMLSVGALRSVRFPLPFHKELEFEFYNALVTSYRARKQISTLETNVEYISEGQAQSSHSILAGNSADATNAGFSLIGYSGCGKSSAISILVSHYPQVIIHGDNTTERFPQIVYLVVNCIANSNFSALYEGIGDAIDKALGNIRPVYAKEIARTNGLGRKAEKVKEYVERFAIGIIIFDEIQLIDFRHTKENSFDSLMTLSNRTKAAIAVVGTEDARNKMFTELRTSRRIGIMIKGHTYCESKKYFAYLAKELMKYQWFEKMITPTQELIDTLYDLTKGIIDQLIGVYICVHLEYLKRNKKPIVDSDFVRKVAEKYYPNLQEVLINMDTETKENEIAEMKRNAELKITELLDNEKQKQNAETILNKSTEQAKININLANVVANITMMYDFSDAQIEEAFNKVIARKSSKGKTEKEISRLTLERLNQTKERTRRNRKQQTPSISQMKDFLGISED